MKKSLLLFALLFIGAISISATLKEESTVEKELIGRWYVESMIMGENQEDFKSEDSAPWMEFNDNNVLLLGESSRDPQTSNWVYDSELNVLHLDAFGEELPFEITELNETKLTIKATAANQDLAILKLTRSFN